MSVEVGDFITSILFRRVDKWERKVWTVLTNIDTPSMGGQTQVKLRCCRDMRQFSKALVICSVHHFVWAPRHKSFAKVQESCNISPGLGWCLHAVLFVSFCFLKLSVSWPTEIPKPWTGFSVSRKEGSLRSTVQAVSMPCWGTDTADAPSPVVLADPAPCPSVSLSAPTPCLIRLFLADPWGPGHSFYSRFISYTGHYLAAAVLNLFQRQQQSGRGLGHFTGPLLQPKIYCFSRTDDKQHAGAWTACACLQRTLEAGGRGRQFKIQPFFAYLPLQNAWLVFSAGVELALPQAGLLLEPGHSEAQETTFRMRAQRHWLPRNNQLFCWAVIRADSDWHAHKSATSVSQTSHD